MKDLSKAIRKDFEKSMQHLISIVILTNVFCYLLTSFVIGELFIFFDFNRSILVMAGVIELIIIIVSFYVVIKGHKNYKKTLIRDESMKNTCQSPECNKIIKTGRVRYCGHNCWAEAHGEA